MPNIAEFEELDAISRKSRSSPSAPVPEKAAVASDNMETSKILLLILYTCLLGVGQLLFKLSARGSSESLFSILFSPLFVSSILLYAGLTVFWVWILKSVPLSKAYPFVALSFVITPLLGVSILDEPLGRLFWPGSVAIVLGVVLIAQP